MDRRPDFSKENAQANVELAFAAGAFLMFFALLVGYLTGVIN